MPRWSGSFRGETATRRRAEREAIHAVLEECGLIESARGGAPMTDRNAEDLRDDHTDEPSPAEVRARMGAQVVGILRSVVDVFDGRLTPPRGPSWALQEMSCMLFDDFDAEAIARDPAGFGLEAECSVPLRRALDAWREYQSRTGPSDDVCVHDVCTDPRWGCVIAVVRELVPCLDRSVPSEGSCTAKSEA